MGRILIGDRAQFWNESVSAHVWHFVLRCAKCDNRISRYTRGALVIAACEAGWAPDETDDGADVFLCPKHAPTGDL